MNERACVLFWECVNLVQLCECAFKCSLEDSFHSINVIFHSTQYFNNYIFPAKTTPRRKAPSSRPHGSCVCVRGDRAAGIKLLTTKEKFIQLICHETLRREASIIIIIKLGKVCLRLCIIINRCPRTENSICKS